MLTNQKNWKAQTIDYKTRERGTRVNMSDAGTKTIACVTCIPTLNS